MQKRVFAIAAHPDDIEFKMTGTLFLLKERGYELHYMNIANGSCGTTRYSVEEIIKMRREESIAACEYLGATYHESVCNDMEIFFEKETLQKVAAVMREVSPEIMLTNSPNDYMEDHQNACRLAVTGAFALGMPNYPTVPQVDHVVQDVTIYHAQPVGNRTPLRQIVCPDLFVDISNVIENCLEMLSFHKSQRDWLDESQGHEYLESLRSRAKTVGDMSGRYKYSEGWRRHDFIGFSQEEMTPLEDALGELVATAEE
jgi:LmbE family N-acetylglucosaminyl deacetylase